MNKRTQYILTRLLSMLEDPSDCEKATMIAYRGIYLALGSDDPHEEDLKELMKEIAELNSED